MRKKILELEKKANQLEPDSNTRNDWNQQVQEYADQFLDNISERPAYQSGDGKEVLSLAISPEGHSMKMVLNTLKNGVDEAGINPASGGHLGYIPGGGVFPTALGDYLAAVTNRYAGIFFANPGAVRIENLLIRWMCKMVGYPDGALGNLASGGSIANLTAFTAARDWKEIKARDFERSVIYLTAQVHHCVQKAIRIAGMREAIVRYIPMNDKYQMDVTALKKQIEIDRSQDLKPFLVVASAGTTDTGAIDPLDQIADIAKSYDLWMHVDAAYGGFFMMMPEMKERFRGIERSDSVAIDPHKGLFLSYGLGALLIKNVEALHKTHYYRANYMQDATADYSEANPADLSPELTKHFRGLRMWLSLHLFGTKPFEACLHEKHLLAKYFWQEVQKLNFEVGPEPPLSVATYRFIPQEGDPNEFNQWIVDKVKEDGQLFVSSTTIEGHFWIRLAVLSFRTKLWHIDRYLEILKQLTEKK